MYVCLAYGLVTLMNACFCICTHNYLAFFFCFPKAILVHLLSFLKHVLVTCLIQMGGRSYPWCAMGSHARVSWQTSDWLCGTWFSSVSSHTLRNCFHWIWLNSAKFLADFHFKVKTEYHRHEKRGIEVLFWLCLYNEIIGSEDVFMPLKKVEIICLCS